MLSYITNDRNFIFEKNGVLLTKLHYIIHWLGFKMPVNDKLGKMMCAYASAIS